MLKIRVHQNVGSGSRAILLLAVAMLLVAVPCRALPTGPNSPATCVDDVSIGTAAWTFPSRATASDDSRTTKSIDHVQTHYLNCTDFGFSISSSENIDGIIVENEVSLGGTGETVADAAQRLVRSGSIGATDRSNATAWTTTDTYLSHGAANDRWGECWCAKPSGQSCDNPACGNVNNPDFGAVVSAIHTSGTGATARVDHVRITIYHSAATPTSTPTQTPTSTLTRTPTETPTTTLTGTISSTPTQTGTPTPFGNQCVAAAPGNPCIPGGGSRTTDCMVEWLATPVPLLVDGTPKPDVKNGIQRNRLYCYEGDPRCDADPNLDNKSCTFSNLYLCINNTDLRYPDCLPSDLATFELKSPKYSSVDPADIANRGEIESQADGGGGGHGLTVLRGSTTVLPGAANGTPNSCSRTMNLTVPLKQTTSGAVRRAKRRFKISAVSTSGIRDIDGLTLECRPSTCGNGLIEDDHEVCDDGNRDNGDGCNQACQSEGATPTPTITGTPTISATPSISPIATVTNSPGGATATSTPTPTSTTGASSTPLTMILQPGGGSNGSCRGVCSGGINPGASCAASGDCRVCQGGSKAGQNCTATANCPGGTCPTGGSCSSAKTCLGGPYNGLTCSLASDCNGCNPNLICRGAGNPLACCTGVDLGSCPLTGSCAIIQNRVTLGNVFPILLPLNGVCVPRVSPASAVLDPDVHCTTNSECTPIGKNCQFNQLSLLVGAPDGNGEASLTIPQASLLLTPAVVTPLGVACVTAGGDGSGTVDCDGGRINLSSSFSSDHNTTPGDPNNSGPSLGLADDPTCSNIFTQASGNISLSCLEAAFCVGGTNDGLSCTDSIADCPNGGTCTPRGAQHCNGGVNAGQACSVDGDCPGAACVFCSSAAQPKALHNGVCNSPTVVAQSGTFGAGDMNVDIPLALLVLQNTADYGPDKLPCTPDDIGTASPVGVALTTGTSSLNVYDVDDSAQSCQGGPQHNSACTTDADCSGGGRCTTSRIAPSSLVPCTSNAACASGELCVDTATALPCSGGTCVCRTVCQQNAISGALTTCVAQLNGTGLSCPNLSAGTLTGLKFGGGFPAFDTTANDIATLFQFVAQ